MTESMYGWCETGRNHLHERTCIGYEKVAEGTNVIVKGQAPFRYFTVWVCQSCARTWWIEDHPKIELES